MPRRSSSPLFSALLLPAVFLACSSSPSGDADGGGGAGGTPASGGQTNAGGSGGGVATGGAADSGGSPASGGSTADYPALEECAGASVDRLQKWWGTAEGPTVPGADQSLLVSEGDHYVAHVEFQSAPSWHVAPIWIGNAYAGVDVSSSTELRITYNATSEFWLQLRPESTYSGGDKWHHALPATGGSDSTVVIPLDAASWVEKFGTPPESVEDAKKELLAVVMIGNTNNVITVKSLRIRGYEPPCL